MQPHKLYFLTSNPHKVEEVKKIIADIEHFSIEIKEIRSDSFKEVTEAKLKEAKNYITDHLSNQNYVLLVEDAGLEINALNKFPGTYSKWVFDKIGSKGILKLMKGETKRDAKFVCVVAAYISNEKKIIFAEGEVKGSIAENIRGAGWGYDPIFIPKGHNKTFGEDPALKEKLSHRNKAWVEMKEMLKSMGYL